MAKGEDYEKEVADMVEDELRLGAFGLDPNLGRVIRKPSYFSRDRKRNISFDVSIEVCRKGMADPYLIWIWECKNYSHSVPVDDVEEFHAKLGQVGADRTKGTMISPIGFDSGSLEFARSKGIGLWRWVPQESLISLMEDKHKPHDFDIIRALTTADTSGFRSYGFFYGLTCDGHFTIDLKLLIDHEFLDV